MNFLKVSIVTLILILISSMSASAWLHKPSEHDRYPECVKRILRANPSIQITHIWVCEDNIIWFFDMNGDDVPDFAHMHAFTHINGIVLCYPDMITGERLKQLIIKIEEYMTMREI